MNDFHQKTLDSEPIFNSSWIGDQRWCNFVLFKPLWLPNGLIQTKNKIRKESHKVHSSHRAEFHSLERSLSIKQFLYDWAPPAYDHPCLWMDTQISTPANTPLPIAYLIGNNCLWFGFDYRGKPAFTINLMRTQIEITVLHGSFEPSEIVHLVHGLIPLDPKAKDTILNKSFAELMFSYRHESEASPVPTSYFDHTRADSFKCYPYSTQNKNTYYASLPGSWLTSNNIENYRLDSLFLFGKDKQHIQEVEYYFESIIEPGSYIRLLVTKASEPNAIQFPPGLSDQECHYKVHTLRNGDALYHAWSKTNDSGSHSLIFKKDEVIINCIIKPAPWTTLNWARNLCENMIQN